MCGSCYDCVSLARKTLADAEIALNTRKYNPNVVRADQTTTLRTEMFMFNNRCETLEVAYDELEKV